MIYFLVTITIKPGVRAAFHKYWRDECLPQWEKHGAKHIGSFDAFIGATDSNQIIRLFAFKDMAALGDWQISLQRSEPGTKYMDKLNDYVVSSQKQIVLPVSYSPLQ